jgi:hypothetical protein
MNKNAKIELFKQTDFKVMAKNRKRLIVENIRQAIPHFETGTHQKPVYPHFSDS